MDSMNFGDEFLCGYCQEKFSSLTLFLQHKVQHVDMGKPGGCPLCGMAFSRQVSLREHLVRKHNILHIKSAGSSGKARGRWRKEAADTGASREPELSVGPGPKPPTSVTESQSFDAGIGAVIAARTDNETVLSSTGGGALTAASADLVESDNSGGGRTMHIIIDKINGSDLQGVDLASTALQAACPPAFPSPASAALVASPDMGQLMEQVGAGQRHGLVQSSPGLADPPVGVADPPHVFQDHTHSMHSQSHTHSMHSQSHAHSMHSQSHAHSMHSHCHSVQGKVSDGVQDDLHSVQNQQVALHSSQDVQGQPKLPTSQQAREPGGREEGQGDIADSVKSTPSPQTNPSLPPQPQPPPSTKSPKTWDEDSDLDFLFVLVSSHVKRKSFNYSKQLFRCFHCHYKTTWRRALVKHMRDVHADSLAVHQCITVNKAEKLQDQQVMRMSEYWAVLAGQRRQGSSQRVRGVEHQDLPGYHPCSHCHKVFGRLRYLRKHQVIHKVEKKFLCDDCGKAFKTKAYLAAHRQTHRAKVYSCSQCDFTSSINALIHAHRQLHNSSSVICEVCGSAYNDRATLKKHQQVHDAARPFPCAYPGCTWRFKSEVMCRAHYRSHTTSGRFVCHLCSYVFRHKHHLQRHLGKVHGMDEAAVYRTTCSSRAQPPHPPPPQPKGEGDRKQLVQVVQEDQPLTDAVNLIVNSGLSGSPARPQSKGVGECESKQLVQVVQQDDDQPLADTVNLIVNSGLSTEQLQSVLESGQFVIATDDNDDSPVNYEVANITMNVSYDSLAESTAGVMEGQAILIPNDAECSQIIFQQEAETVPASIEA